MYIFNTSFMVDYEIHTLWLEMMRKHLIPLLEERGYDNPVFTRVVSNDNPGHFTYSLQVPMEDLSRYHEFEDEVLNEYRAVAVPVFAEKAPYFSTLLKKVELK